MHAGWQLATVNGPPVAPSARQYHVCVGAGKLVVVVALVVVEGGLVVVVAAETVVVDEDGSTMIPTDVASMVLSPANVLPSSGTTCCNSALSK